MSLIKCAHCGKEYSDLLSVCKHCKKSKEIIINSDDNNESLNVAKEINKKEINTTEWNLKKLYWVIPLIIMISVYYFNSINSENNIETCVEDGTCYYGIYRNQVISADYGKYIWIGELNGKETVYRFERVKGISISKRQGSRQSIKEGGKTIAMKIQFPFDKTMDTHRYLNWNGRWVCDGCNKISMPSKLRHPFLDDAHNWPADWNWQHFFNN